MTAYYNEIDPYAAQWLRNLIDAGHIARGDVDERSIVDVKPDDLRGYTQAHFFAGIGGWSLALRLAGWPDDRPVWTGSCPCQPFSAAGTGKAADDERHLWPAWLPLIAERRPSSVFGEQVEAAIGWGWLDSVFADLETEGYACGATVLPACSVGAPHIRQRLWFVAYADGGDASTEGLQRGGQQRQQPQDCGPSELANSDGARRGSWRPSKASARGNPSRIEPPGLRASGGVADTMRERGRGREPWGWDAGNARQPGEAGGFWSNAEWIACSDGKCRPVGPNAFPLGHGIRNRAPQLRAYGNAIVPQVAAAFIGASMT